MHIPIIASAHYALHSSRKVDQGAMQANQQSCSLQSLASCRLGSEKGKYKTKAVPQCQAFLKAGRVLIVRMWPCGKRLAIITYSSAAHPLFYLEQPKKATLHPAAKLALPCSMHITACQLTPLYIILQT